MVLYQSLMYNICITFLSFATAVRWSVTIRDHFLLRGSLISSTSKEKPGRFKASQTGTQSPSAAIRRETFKKKNRNQKQGAGLRPRARPVRIWEQCHIHVTISFPTLSPIWKFPLKFLYFDIIKKYKRGLFSPQCVFCDGSHGNEGVVQALDTGCKCWAAGRQAASWVIVPGVGSRGFIVHFFLLFNKSWPNNMCLRAPPFCES